MMSGIALAQTAEPTLVATKPEKILDISKPAIVKSEMTLLWSGIIAGRWDQTIILNKDRYKINGTAQTAGVIALFVDAKAGFETIGNINDTQVETATTELNFNYNDDKSKLEMEFENKELIRQSLIPERKEPEETGRIPVEPYHLKNVIDPFAALVLPVKPEDIGNGNAICNQRMKVFDGRRTMRLQFSYKSQEEVEIEGFKGQVYTCKVQFYPIAGHRADSRSTKFMAENNDIEITLTQIGNRPFYTLYSFTSPLLRGRITVKPTKFAMGENNL